MLAIVAMKIRARRLISGILFEQITAGYRPKGTRQVMGLTIRTGKC